MKVLCSVCVCLALLLTLPVRAQDEKAVHECSPFALPEYIPDPLSGSWQPENDVVVVAPQPTDGQTVQYYEHKRLKGLRLGVYTYFGEVVMMAWACGPRRVDPMMHHIPDHMLAVKNGVEWYVAFGKKPQVVEVRDKKSGKIVAVRIVLLPFDGRAGVDREVKQEQR